jgi:hypothetical protein
MDVLEEPVDPAWHWRRDRFAMIDRRPAAARTHEPLVHAIVRAGLCVAASALVACSLARVAPTSPRRMSSLQISNRPNYL